MNSSPIDSPDASDPRIACLLRGADLFNRQQFFEAHEVWEDAWRESAGEERRYFQGLIQCAVALEHSGGATRAARSECQNDTRQSSRACRRPSWD